jgi:diguanylate cyclase (GGDEF)-like protein
MNLDVPSLMAMESFVAACAAVALFVAWSLDRKTPALAIWGGADILAAVGVFALMRGAVLHQPSWSAAGGAILALSSGLALKAARTLDEKPAAWALALAGVFVLVGLSAAVPQSRGFGGSLSLAISAVYSFAAAVSLWLGRRERLPARWPLIAVTALHVAVLSIGACSTFLGFDDQDAAPSLASLFGLVHFESIIFSLGAAIALIALVTERSEAASRAAANIDPLTGIANRAAFMASAERVIERCRREGAPVCVGMFDLDRFKAVNDTHGHAVGDAVIRRFCEMVAVALRPNEIFGRIGGEEFAIVLPGSSIEAAGIRAERIRASFATNCRFIGERRVNATVSAGVSTSPNGEHALLSQLLEHSDAALYRAKASGRNCVKRADPGAPEAALSRAPRVA